MVGPGESRKVLLVLRDSHPLVQGKSDKRGQWFSTRIWRVSRTVAQENLPCAARQLEEMLTCLRRGIPKRHPLLCQDPLLLHYPWIQGDELLNARHKERTYLQSRNGDADIKLGDTVEEGKGGMN